MLVRTRPARLAAAVVCLCAGVSVAHAETLSISWDPSTSSDVTGYRVYVSTTAYTTAVDVGHVTAWDFGAAVPGTEYCFAVSAYSAAYEGQKSARVCGYSDRPPMLTNPGPQASLDGQPATLQLVGSDPDGSAVTFGATGLPPGMVLRDTTGFIEGTPTTRGVYSVTATATDGLLTTSQTFAWTIQSLPETPVLVSPSGTNVSVTPTFVWQAVASALTYRLAVDDAGASDGKVLVDVTRNAAGCSTGSGSCQYKPSTTLAVGPAAWTVRASNAVGDGPWAPIRAFTVVDGSSSLPTITITTPTTSATLTTQNATITIGGSAADSGGIAAVTWVNSAGGSGTATGTTTWSASVQLQQGSNVIVVTARDTSGNTATDTLTVTYADQASPVVAFEWPTSAATFETSERTLQVRGTASDAFGVTEVRWVNDRGGSGIAVGTTSWSVSAIDLQLGRNTILVTARDAAGHSGSSALAVTLVDRTPPVVAITAPTGLATYGTSRDTLVLAGEASDNYGIASVTWSNDRGGSGLAEGSSAWRVPSVSLRLGVNTITVVARDGSGNETAARLAVTVTDTTAPSVQIEGPTVESSTMQATTTVRLSGRASDDFGVTSIAWANSRGGGGATTGLGPWSATADLQVGTNVLTVTAFDASGNSGTDTLTVVVDTTPPVVTITAPSATGTYRTTAATVSMSGTTSDASGIGQVMWTTDTGSSGSVVGSTEWVLPLLPLHDGANTITITAVDLVGNSAAATLVVTYEAADLPPTLSITNPVGPFAETTAATISIAGTAADDRGPVELTWSNERGGTGVLTVSGEWTVPGIVLKIGNNAIRVDARDTAGNTATAQVLVKYSRERASSSTSPQSPSATASSREALALSQNVEVSAPSLASASEEMTIQAQPQLADSTVASVQMSSAQPQLAAAPPPADTRTTTAGSTSAAAPTRDPAPETRIEKLLDPPLAARRRTPPRIVIAAPAGGRYTTAASSVAVNGTASLPEGVALVSWSSDRTGGGPAQGTEAWQIEKLPLLVGANVVTVTASDGAGELVTAQLVVVRTPPLGVSVTTPTASKQLTTSQRAIALAGTATGDVTKVTWAANWGGSGTASGTKAWRIDAIGLERGVNIITVSASDAQGRVARRTLTITANPPAKRSRNR